VSLIMAGTPVVSSQLIFYVSDVMVMRHVVMETIKLRVYVTVYL